MSESYFGLTDRPFAASPRVERYYPGQAIEGARVAVARCIERAEGYGLVVGPVGTGKTLLCQVLAEQFRGRLAPVMLSGTRIPSRKALLQEILYELGLPLQRREEGELRLALIDRLNPRPGHPQGMLLLVDEAHNLPTKLLEELRLLTNIVRQGEPRVRLVIAGSPALEERLAHPRLASFQQRIAARCYLGSFSAAETREFVRAQTAAVDGDADAIWTDAGLSAIHKASDGVPRLVNQVSDHALLLAAARGVRQIDARQVEQAWAELQQLPAPWDEDRPSGGEAAGEQSVIEFGALDDATDSSVVAYPGGAATNSFGPGSAADRPTGVLAISKLNAGELETGELENIGQQIDDLQDEFRPAGTVGADFQADFQEEEVVIDAFAGLDAPTVRPMIPASPINGGGERGGRRANEAPQNWQSSPKAHSPESPDMAPHLTDDVVLPDAVDSDAEFTSVRFAGGEATAAEPAVLPLRPHLAPLGAAGFVDPSTIRISDAGDDAADDGAQDIVYAEQVGGTVGDRALPSPESASVMPSGSNQPVPRKYRKLFSSLHRD